MKKYNEFKKITFIITIACIILTMYIVLTIENILLIGILLIILAVAAFLILLFLALFYSAKEADKNSIRIISIGFSTIEEGLDKLYDSHPSIFSRGNHIGIFLYNTENGHYYELYKKDDIRWMRDIGKINPREKYYY